MMFNDKHLPGKFDASRRGKKELKSFRDKKCKARTVVGRKSLLCDPGSELRLGGRENRKGEDNTWDGKKKKKKAVIRVLV